MTYSSGSIRLDTEEGSFTEMCIRLPLEPSVQTEDAEGNDNEPEPQPQPQ